MFLVSVKLFLDTNSLPRAIERATCNPITICSDDTIDTLVKLVFILKF